MLYYNTVSERLLNYLNTLMNIQELEHFRLVGGTALSLQLGHRVSVDIDLFSDLPYGTIDFDMIDELLKTHFRYTEPFSDVRPAIGKSYYIGNSQNEALKLDVFYTDAYIQSPYIKDNIRLATTAEIIAMKTDIIQRGGRKKDFWDLHELLLEYSVAQMLQLHKQRYEYNHEEQLILHNLTDFTLADDDFTPICLRGKHWELIKEDMKEAVSTYLREQ